MIEAVSVESLAHSPEEVFDFVADVANQPRWNSEVTNLVQLTEGPPRVGSRMTGDYNRIGRIETEITVFDRPSRLVLVSTGAAADLTLDFHFEPEGEGTLMTVSGAVTVKGAMRFMEGALRGPVAQQYADRARAIKTSMA